MRKYYDDQVHHKRQRQQQEKDNDVQMGNHIRDKVSTINKLMDLDNNKRQLMRGQIALENITAHNTAKQKQSIIDNQSKFETIDTL